MCLDGICNRAAGVYGTGFAANPLAGVGARDRLRFVLTRS